MTTFTVEDTFRGIILYGLTSSTYKMAVGYLLTNYANKSEDKISLSDMAVDILDLYKDRFQQKGYKPQVNISGRKTVVVNQLDNLTRGKISKDKAISIIKKDALYNMVLPKFHNFGKFKSPVNFYEFDENYLYISQKSIDLFCEENLQVNQNEITSRWDLIESSFESIHNSTPLEEHFVDLENELIQKGYERQNITSAVSAFSGYQQNRCFYCGEDLYDPIHVDHVIPRSIVRNDAMWNLVLSHANCNLSKSDNNVAKSYIENLIERNEGLIESRHPLRNVLINDLGTTKLKRKNTIISIYNLSKQKINRFWRDEHYRADEDLFYRRFVRAIGTRDFEIM